MHENRQMHAKHFPFFKMSPIYVWKITSFSWFREFAPTFKNLTPFFAKVGTSVIYVLIVRGGGSHLGTVSSHVAQAHGQKQHTKQTLDRIHDTNFIVIQTTWPKDIKNVLLPNHNNTGDNRLLFWLLYQNYWLLKFLGTTLPNCGPNELGHTCDWIKHEID